jgi:high affinity Mn2+ porin
MPSMIPASGGAAATRTQRAVAMFAPHIGLAMACACFCLPGTSLAQSSPTPDQSAQTVAPSETVPPQIWAIYGQATFTDQYHPAFRSLLRGPNSLDPGSRGDETFDFTLFAGLRPWAGAEIWINPEVDQGFGLSNTLGVAAFTSAEAYKVGAAVPYVRIPQLFFRQTIDLGGAAQKVDPTLNVLGGSQTDNRVVFWLGKFGVGDIFDTNAYANDGRNQFLNWALVNASTFDYAADAWGFTYGTAAEWYQDWWALRGGAFALSRVPNSQALDTSFSQVQFVGEAEERHRIRGRDGKLKITAFLSRGRMGGYNNAIALAAQTGGPPDIAAVRQYRSRSGVSANLEQAITDQLGLFARAGYSEGGREAYEFTDVNKTFSIGLAMQGNQWMRPDDTVGLAFVIDDASRRAKNFFNAGGLGILVGDGSLPQSGPEQVVETYYRYALASYAQVTADYQFVNNPGYDRLRGPVSVLAVRVHVQY